MPAGDGQSVPRHFYALVDRLVGQDVGLEGAGYRAGRLNEKLVVLARVTRPPAA